MTDPQETKSVLLPHLAHRNGNDADPNSGHLLRDHLIGVSGLAAEFAAAIGGGEWAKLAGLWHDLGKYRHGFQQYIRQNSNAHIEDRLKRGDKTHSAAGALWAKQLFAEKLGNEGRMLACPLQYVIAGHHAGLDNWDDGLARRLNSTEALREIHESLAAGPPDEVLNPEYIPLSLKDLPLRTERLEPGRFALWVRMLFSCLVDADFLDTEAYMNSKHHGLRSGAIGLEMLKQSLDQYMADVAANSSDTAVNRIRATVLRQCREKATRPPGVFSLTVPTGGGKTLSSLTFGIDHAIAHGKRRVIYAIPYTSIIEQTANVFRDVFASFGGDAIIEHHSNAESDPETETARSRLACENWDAPIVVTTNVQFFESLFARRTSRCRKIHNVANSVVVLDEAQLLPVEFLQPIVDVLRYLVRDFGVTLVLCTATQPELTTSLSADPGRGLRRGFQPGEITEIIDNVPALYSALKRVKLHVPGNLDASRTWDDIAAEIGKHPAVLAVVNRRADARTLFHKVRGYDPVQCWHLSALMCAQHRSDVLGEIKAALRRRRDEVAQGQAPEPVRVVSTQLVEAGVDLDFPVVYRAMAGLDSIAQAAGRCNREGILANLGDVHVFVPPTQPPPGLLRQARDTCRAIWHDCPPDPFATELFRRYFERLYHDASSLDAKAICEALRMQPDSREYVLAVRFRDAAENFRLIDDREGGTVLVRYRSPLAIENIDALLALLEREGPSRWLLRKVQRYGVSVYRHQIESLLRSGDIRMVVGCPGLYVQAEGWDAFYDPLLGANVDGAPGDPAGLVV